LGRRRERDWTVWKTRFLNRTEFAVIGSNGKLRQESKGGRKRNHQEEGEARIGGNGKMEREDKEEEEGEEERKREKATRGCEMREAEVW
jgi:hypothetical protein